MTSINLVYFDICFYLKFVQRYNKYKTNLEGDTLSSIYPRIMLGQPLGSPTGPALRLIPSLIRGLILDLVLLSQLVAYLYCCLLLFVSYMYKLYCIMFCVHEMYSKMMNMTNNKNGYYRTRGALVDSMCGGCGFDSPRC